MSLRSLDPRNVRWLVALAALIGLVVPVMLPSEKPRAHCDTLDGPVVMEARRALESGDVTPVLKWVRMDNEGEIRAAFAKALVVRAKGPEARDLADTYFFETLVRVHRAGEGAPFTGLKPAGAGLGPALIAADKALETGSADALVTLLTNEIAAGIRARFARATELKRRADESVDKGREFVEAYVSFVHYVEALSPGGADASKLPDAHGAEASHSHGH